MADSDIYATGNFGYDPTVVETIPIVPAPVAPTAPPSSATVNRQYLPPVGKQTTPSCFVWSSTYCATTFAAALNNGVDPNTAAGQASPIYTYIQVEEQQGVTNCCKGGMIKWCFDYLGAEGGTASMQGAPDLVGCKAAWAAWGGKPTLTRNWQFQVMQYQGVSLIGGADGLAAMRNLIWLNIPIVYGTSLYTDFVSYAGSPVPYVGDHIILMNNNKPVGHCMVIIGYDDNCGPNGAVLLQNSFGQEWGSVWPSNGGTAGYMWMDYVTFQTLAQGAATTSP